MQAVTVLDDATEAEPRLIISKHLADIPCQADRAGHDVMPVR